METHFYDSLDQYHKEKHISNLAKVKELRETSAPLSGKKWMAKINAIFGYGRIAAREKILRRLDFH